MSLKEVVDWELEEWQAFTGQTDRFRGLTLKSIEKAGEGNMNLTLRLQFEDGSVIAKHAPPFCFKYPTIPAPVERLSMELEFFRLASTAASLKARLPEIHYHDPERNIALLEDLGVCQDYGHLYDGITGEQEGELLKLVQILSELHGLSTGEVTLRNEKMRGLNHQYIFVLPFSDKNFDLTPLFGPRTREAQRFRDDVVLEESCRRLGALYLKDTDTLVHGDFYPRSWLHTGRGVYVIDPEFGFKGLAEFDVGVFVAHLKLSKLAEEKIMGLLKNYQRPPGFKMSLAFAFAGCEMTRRLLHVAQLPLQLSPGEKIVLLEESRRMINSGVEDESTERRN